MYSSRQPLVPPVRALGPSTLQFTPLMSRSKLVIVFLLVTVVGLTDLSVRLAPVFSNDVPPVFSAGPSAQSSPSRAPLGVPGSWNESIVQAPANSDVELPVEVLIPALGVDVAVEYVGKAPDGSMDVPKDPDQVAWYELGARPGETGNAVIAGHVDWAGVIRPFWGLKNLQPGDTITVIAADSTQYQFGVTDVELFDAASAPIEYVFGQTDDAELTLITCGGDFDHSTHQYLDRVVVKAVLQ